MDVYFSKPAVLCGAGKNIEELWKSVSLGDQSGFKRCGALNGKEFWVSRVDDGLIAEKSSARHDMRIMRLEEKCLEQISSVIESVAAKFGADRVGVCVGSCDNGTELSLAGHRIFFEKGKFAPDYTLEVQGADYAATFIVEKYALGGPALVFETACSSSAAAIGRAADLIRSGVCDAVVAGGVDIASDTVLMGFDSLGAVSPEKTNPFSVNRRGITLGEAAAFFVLSREPFDGDSVRLLGFGESADAYHMTSPDPGGDGARRAMEEALKKSALSPLDVDYVNLHGTGTKFNDLMEARAVKAVFGDVSVPCSTTKPVTAHTLGAAGALEAAVCWAAIKNSTEGGSVFPVQVWDGQRDLEMPEINIVSRDGAARFCEKKGRIDVCMSNSFAFGGANACILLGR